MHRSGAKTRSASKKPPGVFFTRLQVLEGWPLVLWFYGRGEGQEHVLLPGIPKLVRWKRNKDGERKLVDVEPESPDWRYDGPLGVFVHALLAEVPPRGFPARYWPGAPELMSVRQVVELFSESRRRENRPRIDDLWSRAPLGRIRVQPVIKRQGVGQGHLRKLHDHAEHARAKLREMAPIEKGTGERQTGWWWGTAFEDLPDRARELVRLIGQPAEYLHKKSQLAFAWYAQDVEAAAWVELLHALDTGATSRSCLCGAPFLRPRATPGRFCLTCRHLTWRQQRNVGRFPVQFRRHLALDLWQSQSKSEAEAVLARYQEAQVAAASVRN